MRTLELKRLEEGFYNDELGLGPINFQTTDDRLQSLVFTDENGFKELVDVKEIDLRDMTLQNAIKKHQREARHLGVSNLKVTVKHTRCRPSYGR